MEPSFPHLRALCITGDATIVGAIADVCVTFDDAFPNQVLGWYALGSFADASAITTSDLDLTVVFRDALNDEDRKHAEAVCGSLAQGSPVELDIEFSDERSLACGASPTFKMGSVCVWGDDIREHVPLVSLTEWTRDRMHSSWWRIARLFSRPKVLLLPLEYPDPTDPFRGYTRRLLRIAGGSEVPCTRDLVRLVGWAATGLLALQCGIYVARKSDVHPMYREHIGDEWADLIEAVYTQCRQRWSYLIPDEPAEREQLRDICDQTLGFERHFSMIYREYLLAELGSEDPEATQFGAEVMSRAPLRDDAVVAELINIAHIEGTQSASLARSALAALR